jgi:hypothetical protein
MGGKVGSAASTKYPDFLAVKRELGLSQVLYNLTRNAIHNRTLWMIKNLHNVWPDEVYLYEGYKVFDGLVSGCIPISKRATAPCS